MLSRYEYFLMFPAVRFLYIVISDPMGVEMFHP
jgi:hypothetical protein